MLYQVVYDTFHGENAERPARGIDHRQVPIASFLHPPDGGSYGLVGLNHHGISRHTPLQGQVERKARRQNAAQQVAFGKDAHQLAVLADENATDPLLPHRHHRVGHRLFRKQAQRRSGLQPSDTLHLEIAGQLHVSFF
jgi:hypothetical protein